MTSLAPYLIFLGFSGIVAGLFMRRNLRRAIEAMETTDPANKGPTLFAGSCVSLIITGIILCSLICAGFGSIGIIQSN